MTRPIRTKAIKLSVPSKAPRGHLRSANHNSFAKRFASPQMYSTESFSPNGLGQLGEGERVSEVVRVFGTYCEMVTWEVLDIGTLELGRKGNMNVKLYCTWTCTGQPGLLLPALHVELPGHVVHTNRALAVVLAEGRGHDSRVELTGRPSGTMPSLGVALRSRPRAATLPPMKNSTSFCRAVHPEFNE